MNNVKLGEFIGQSEISLKEAIINALFKAGQPNYFEVIETRGSHATDKSCYYQVILTAFA